MAGSLDWQWIHASSWNPEIKWHELLGFRPLFYHLWWNLDAADCLWQWIHGDDTGFLHSVTNWVGLNTLRPRQNGRHFADDTFERIILNENVWTSITISLKFVRKGTINNIPSLVKIMAWRRSGDKPLSEPMMVRSPTHICVSRPQWVNCTT